MSGLVGQIGARSGVVGSTTDSTQLDYEEGTWTPVLSNTVNGFDGDPSTSATSGHYIKIGKLVYLRGQLEFSSDTNHTSYSYITGLPFTPSTDTTAGIYSSYAASDAFSAGAVRVGLGGAAQLTFMSPTTVTATYPSQTIWRFFTTYIST